MVRIIKTPLAAVVLLLFALAVSQARAEVYKFSGVLPSDVVVTGDMVNLANPGDSWTVFLNIDLGAGRVSLFPSFDFYDPAVQSAEIRFSGGYSATLTPDTIKNSSDHAEFFVYNDYVVDVAMEDGVYANIQAGPAYLYTAASTEIGIGPGPLENNALPEFPTSIAHDLGDVAITVLEYISPGGGEVSYLAANGVRFEVVPEPSTITLWCVALVGLGGVWWRKRRAG